MNDIPWHQLYDRADCGVEIDHFQPGDSYEEEVPLGAHRDDHYIFFLVESGNAELMIDFQVVPLTPGAIYFILPGQVHHRIKAEKAYGWYLAIDNGLLSAEQRHIFEARLALQQPAGLNAYEQQRFSAVLSLLYRHYLEQDGQPFYRPILYSFTQVFTGMVAVLYQNAAGTGLSSNRKTQLSQSFKSLLTERYKTLKSPSAYAGLLNVSTAYLNEALKHTTGLPVSYWIIQALMLEAKRLLYYTNTTVKEIAFELGYEDHTYFSRLLKNRLGRRRWLFEALTANSAINTLLATLIGN
ncbi:helix-turn-helix domain-containing protein [Mucilaginibacter sp. 21P]|uniref:helix-turn-helix domain-containing protein n=1 Tax=Mucilaginibacter sp. 21P TaxID=2778902 RepID=UPI001C58E43B|nr:helix-turn-helix transcriptional regulator [Mucilaginibacter sp. 21P]QXV63709.1 helix-turn-helix domain-containing protein [Mucilaginibacter sp. 21P]